MKKLDSVAIVRDRVIPTERPPLIGEGSPDILQIEGCRVANATDPHGFLDRNRYYFLQVPP
jgi:hypothetical protein